MYRHNYNEFQFRRQILFHRNQTKKQNNSILFDQNQFLDTHKVAGEVRQCDQLLAEPVDNQAPCQHHVQVKEVGAETDQVGDNLQEKSVFRAQGARWLEA